jgi:hypothetical protein
VIEWIDRKQLMGVRPDLRHAWLHASCADQILMFSRHSYNGNTPNLQLSSQERVRTLYENYEKRESIVNFQITEITEACTESPALHRFGEDLLPVQLAVECEARHPK